jgi:hypothetical protein
MAHETFGLVVPLSDALNCIDWLAVSDADVGTTATDIDGIKVIAAVAILVGSAVLVAATVTVCCAEINAGAM